MIPPATAVLGPSPQPDMPKLLPDGGLPGASPVAESSAPQAQNPSKPPVTGLMDHFGLGASSGEGAAAGGGLAEDAVAAAAL